RQAVRLRQRLLQDWLAAHGVAADVPDHHARDAELGSERAFFGDGARVVVTHGVTAAAPFEVGHARALVPFGGVVGASEQPLDLRVGELFTFVTREIGEGLANVVGRELDAVKGQTNGDFLRRNAVALDDVFHVLRDRERAAVVNVGRRIQVRIVRRVTRPGAG